MKQSPEQLDRPTQIVTELIDGRARLSTFENGYHIGSRPMLFDKNYIRLGMVAVHMPLLAGDQVVVHIRVGGNTTLEIVEPSGMVAYNADGVASSYNIHVHIETGGVLIWHGAEFVAAEGSNSVRTTNIHLEKGACSLFKEEIILGRTGESKIHLNNRVRAVYDGKELLTEELIIHPETPRLPGIIGTAKAISVATAFGKRPQGGPVDIHRLELAGPGTIYRALADKAHLAEKIVQPVFDQWREEFLKKGKKIGKREKQALEAS